MHGQKRGLMTFIANYLFFGFDKQENHFDIFHRTAHDQPKPPVNEAEVEAAIITL